MRGDRKRDYPWGIPPHDLACDEIVARATALLAQKWGLWHNLFRFDQPEKALIGAYKPDFLFHVNAPSEQLAVIGEFESSNYAEKDIAGACLLADTLAQRAQCFEEPVLAFVVPDDIRDPQMSHLEERLNLALQQVKAVRILPAQRRSGFLTWFERWAVPLLQRIQSDDADEFE